MTKDDFYCKSNKLIDRIIILLEKQYQELEKKEDSSQRLADLKDGWYKKSGIFIPLKSYEHRILYDGFSKIFIKAFLPFYKHLYNDEDTLFKEFSLRTIVEVGFMRTQVLFSPKVTNEQKQTLKLLITLDDYASIFAGHPDNITTYEKLLKENSKLLTEKQISIFQSTLQSGKDDDNKKHAQNLKKVRGIIRGYQDALYKITDPLEVFQKNNIMDKANSIFFWFSQLLHGNRFQLMDLFSDKRLPGRNKLRVTWVLLLTGINVVNYLSTIIKIKSAEDEIKDINSQFEKLATFIGSSWEILEK